MTKKIIFNAGAAVILSVGLSISAFAQESTPTPTPTPVEAPTPSPSPSPMESPMPSPSPSPTSPSPSPTPQVVPVAVPVAVPVETEKPKTAEAVTNVTTTGIENKKATTETVSSTYDVPLLNVPSFNGTTEIKVKFAGELEGLKGKAYITRKKDGVSQIKMRFDDMKMAPKQKRYVLWAVAPDKSYTKIGQVINTGEKQEAEVRGETNLNDFGLFVTQEEKEVTAPTGTVYAPFSIGGM